jgi:hypothetical protein
MARVPALFRADLVVLAASTSLSGCGSTFTRLPDGTIEREDRSTTQQRAADALRRAGASTEAKEAQKRADKSVEEERKNAGTNFIADLLFAIFGIGRD